MPPSRRSRRVAVAALVVLERVLGRPRLARLARWMWLEVRLDVSNDPSSNGEYDLLRKACRDVSARGAGVFLDVGANVGDWSNTLIECWDGRGSRSAALQVHAFEPSPVSYAQLRGRLETTVARSGRSDISTWVNDTAVGQAAARASLSVVSPTGGTNTLVPFDDAVGESLPVEVTTLDDYASRTALPAVDFVKVDTEGNDLAVLLGAGEMLEARLIRWIQFEYNHRWVSSRTYLRDAFALAERYGYQVGKITPRGVERYRCWHPELESFREANYLLWHDTPPAGVAVFAWWGE